jgi:NADH-quinone oxidoreductase subunit J
VLPYQRPMAIGLAVVLVVEAVYLILGRNPSVANIIPPTEATNTVEAIRELGMTLFNQYLLPFEITSILLLVAMIGAIVLTKQEKKGEQK